MYEQHRRNKQSPFATNEDAYANQGDSLQPQQIQSLEEESLSQQAPQNGGEAENGVKIIQYNKQQLNADLIKESRQQTTDQNILDIANSFLSSPLMKHFNQDKEDQF